MLSSTFLGSKYFERVKKRSAAGTIFVGLILASCGANSTTAEESTTTSKTVQSVAATTTAMTTTSTIARTSTTVDLVAEADRRVYDSAWMLDKKRLQFIDIIEDNRVLERVDRYEIVLSPPELNTAIMVLTGSSGYRTNENQMDKAWELVGLLGAFWEKSDGPLRNVQGTLKPSLDLTVDGNHFVADHDLMVRLADRLVTREEWLTLASS